MESRVNYIIVGVFVISFSFAFGAFIFWLKKYGLEENYTYYKTYMTESVSGLSTDATVKYRGVDVGTVEQIRINPSNSEEVELLLKVQRDAPIKQDMVVILKFYGLTGLAFIEIEGGSSNSKLLNSVNGEIPVIKSSPSIYTRLNESLPDIAQKLTSALTRVDKLLNNENLDNIGATIKNIKEISHYVKNMRTKINKLVDKSITMEDKIVTSFNKMSDAADSVKRTADEIKLSLDRGDYNIKQLSATTFEQTNELLDDLKNLSAELEEAVLKIQRSPSDLLFKKAKPKLGPGESGAN